MDNFDYECIFDQALRKIKCVRNPHASKPETSDLRWNVVREQALFDFGGSEHEKYERVIKAAKVISLSCLNFIILQMGRLYSRDFRSIDIQNVENKQSKIYFAIKDCDTNCLLFFKEIEENAGWKTKNKEPKEIQKFLDDNCILKCKYIYVMHDYAYLQMIGHNDDKGDPGRGYNLYGIKWFFETYFCEAEYMRFCKALEKYINDVNDYIGYIYTKSLNPNALVNYRKIVEYTIEKFKYDTLLEKIIKGKDENGRIKEYILDKKNFDAIQKQYIMEKTCLVMLGKGDFAESIITAEWLYSSMEKAKAIDLTVVGTGYFKAVEQLMYELICLHKTEGKRIQKNGSKQYILLDSDSIKKKLIDSTLGSMAYFYKYNLDMLRTDLSERTKEYIRETIFAYVKLRNGYFHKHNIHSWKIVEKIRTETFLLIFLLLGSQILSSKDRKSLGEFSVDIFDDYYKLCEYVNYHSGELFYMNFGQEDKMAIACADMNIETIGSDYILYSGVYFRELGDNGRVFRFTKQDLPEAIYLGKFIFANTELVHVEPIKDKKVFEKGKFVGSSIVEEDKFSY